MANTIITPNMTLTVPVAGVDPGPDYAENISNNEIIIDGHNHLGDGLTGKQLGVASLDIDGDLSFNTSNNANNLRSTQYADQSDTLSGVGDVDCVYFLDGDLWVNNGSGTPVQITAGSIVDVTAANTVYAAQAVAANWTIVSTDTYVLLEVDTSTTRSITLPSANSVSNGRYYIIVDKTGSANSNPITINKSVSDTIDGQTSYVLNASFGAVVIISNGSNGWMCKSYWNSNIGNLSTGTAPSNTGRISLSNTDAIKSRNAANSADLGLITLDTNNNVSVGDTSAASISLANALITLPAAVTPVIQHLKATSGAGVDTTEKAQDAASGTNNGGNWVLQGGNRGNGSAVYGGVKLNTGDGTTQLAITPTAVKFSEVMQGQGTVSTVGDIQLRNASSIGWRNAANSANITIGVDSSNIINIGDTTNNNVDISAASNIGLTTGGTNALNLTSATLTSTGVNIAWSNGSASPSISQNTLSSGTGALFTLHSQDVTTGTGGALTLRSGTGSVNPGNLTLIAGSANVLVSSSGDVTLGDSVNSTQTTVTASGPVNLTSSNDAVNITATGGSQVSLISGSNTYGFDSSGNVSGITNINNIISLTYLSSSTGITQIKQGILASGTGNPFTIQAQDVTTGTGGDAVLTSGTGSVAAGNVLLQTGGSTKFRVSPTQVVSSVASFIMNDSGGSAALTYALNSAGSTSVSVATGATSFTLSQASTSAGNGAPMAINAQTSSHSTSTGGALTIGSGAGTSASGLLTLNAGTGSSTQQTLNDTGFAFFTGGAISMGISATAVTLDLAPLQFQLGIAPVISQANLTTNSGSGATFTIHAQNETGTTSVGGALVLSSGTGTSTPGTLALQSGGTPLMTIGGNAGLTWGNTALSTLTGTVTLTAAQQQTPLIVYSGSLSGNITIDFGNIAGFWFLDIGGVTLNAHTVSVKSGTSTIALPTLTTTDDIFIIRTSGSNYISIK